MGNTSRNYGIDLLRMVSMYMVCMLHTLLKGGILASTSSDLPKNYLAWFFEVAAYCAVNCFALISGYVGVKSNFKYRNLFRLWIQAVFYTVGISLIFYFVRPGSIGIKEIAKAFFPICTEHYWYLTSYAIMFFFIPQMNFLLVKQEKKMLKCFIWIFFVLFSLLSLPPTLKDIALQVNEGYTAIWLAYLYIVGGFISIYGINELFTIPQNNKYAIAITSLTQRIWGCQVGRFAIYAVCILITFFIRTFCHQIINHFLGKDPLCFQFVTYNSPTIFLAGVALLELFSNLQLSARFSTFIRFASPLAFSVYLIHTQKLINEHFILGAFEKCSELSIFILPFAIIGIPLAIYLICSIIDYFRLRLFKLIHLA